MYLNNPVIQSFGQDPIYIPSTGTTTVPFTQPVPANDVVIINDMANMRKNIERLAALLHRTAEELDYTLKSNEYTTLQISGFSNLSSKIMEIGRYYDMWQQQLRRQMARLSQPAGQPIPAMS